MRPMTDRSDASVSLRERIARVMFEAYGDTTSPGWDAEYPSMKKIYFDQADAVLAVLANLPESVIERAARGFYEPTVITGVQPSWDRLREVSPEIAINYRRGMRAAFRAAFGINNYKENGK